jgi:hypothetical protein
MLSWGVYSYDSVLSRFEHDKPQTVKVATFPTIPNLAQTIASNLTTVTSHHDRWKTNTLNTPQVKLNIINMERLV